MFRLIYVCLFFIVMGLLLPCLAQQHTFQKQYYLTDTAGAFQTYDMKATPDGGYVLTGLASEQNDYTKMHPFVLKLNCKAEREWDLFFGLTQSSANVNARIIVTHDSDIIMINNLGSYGNYNGLVSRIDLLGNIIWQQTVNLSTGSDVLNDIVETSQGDLIITGSAKNTSDIALVKLSSSGALLWSKTYGRSGYFDDGYALTELSDGNYMLVGRYVNLGSFQGFVMKTDTAGIVQWYRCYGDSNHTTNIFALKETANGDVIVAGSTTIAKTAFNSFSDCFIMRLHANGDTVWTKIINGTPDSYENFTDIEFDLQGNILLSDASASYPSLASVTNRHVLVKLDSAGNLLQAISYNDANSSYPRITWNQQHQLMMSGFTNQYIHPIGFQSLLIRLDSNYMSGCFDTNVLALTQIKSKPIKITVPNLIIGSGGTSIPNTSTFSMAIIDSTLCEFRKPLIQQLQYTGQCAQHPVQFQLQSQPQLSYIWDFGDSWAANDSAFVSNPTYTYSHAGIYQVSVWASDGCYTDSLTTLIILDSMLQNYSVGPDQIICSGDTAALSVNVNGLQYLWSTGDTTQQILVSEAGVFSCSAQNLCGIYIDSVTLQVVTPISGFSVGSDQQFCLGDSVVLQANINGLPYVWNTGDTTQQIIAYQSGTYVCTAQTGICGAIKDSVVLTTKNCTVPCGVWMPDAFTPNGDFRNDVYRPLLQVGQMPDFEFISMSIFNRWGNRIFFTNDWQEGWDGSLNGKKVSADTYFYLVQFSCGTEKITQKGSLTLIR